MLSGSSTTTETGLAANGLPVYACSLSAGFIVVCQVPQIFACSSDIASERSKREVKLLLSKNRLLRNISNVCPPKPLRGVYLVYENPIIHHSIVTFASPSVGPRLSAPAGHLPPHTELLRDTEERLAARAALLSSPLTQDGGVVVVWGHLAAGHLVGVAGGMALAQSEGVV